MGIARPFRDPLYLVAVVTLLGVAIAAGLFTLFSSEGEADQVAVPPSPTLVSTATAAPGATPTATAVLSYADILVDTQRLLDLATVRDALESYHAANGSYPSTNGEFSTLCENVGDAGCALTNFTPDLPASDGELPYWYQSDGVSYTLFAQVANTPEVSGCPSQVPPELEGKPISCLEGGE